MEENEEVIEYQWFTFNEFKALKKNEIMDKRVELIINDYFSNKAYSLSIIKGVD